MRLTYLIAILFVVFTPVAVQAEGMRTLVIDRDTRGTNVRNYPAGDVIDVIPYASPDAVGALLERRVVVVTGQKGFWFSVTYDRGKTGWMHRSVLGFCASPSEDGSAVLKAAPHSLQETGKVVIPVSGEARLVIKKINFKIAPVWAEVEYVDAKGRSFSGWLPEQSLSANPYNECWR